MLSVNDAAELMLENGGYFTAKKLAKHFDVSTRRASSWLGVIKSDVKYRTANWGSQLSWQELVIEPFLCQGYRKKH